MVSDHQKEHPESTTSPNKNLGTNIIMDKKRQKPQDKPNRQDQLDDWGWLNIEQIANNATVQSARQAALNQSSSRINAIFNY